MQFLPPLPWPTYPYQGRFSQLEQVANIAVECFHSPPKQHLPQQYFAAPPSIWASAAGKEGTLEPIVAKIGLRYTAHDASVVSIYRLWKIFLEEQRVVHSRATGHWVSEVLDHQVHKTQWWEVDCLPQILLHRKQSPNVHHQELDLSKLCWAPCELILLVSPKSLPCEKLPVGWIPTWCAWTKDELWICHCSPIVWQIQQAHCSHQQSLSHCLTWSVQVCHALLQNASEHWGKSHFPDCGAFQCELHEQLSKRKYNHNAFLEIVCVLQGTAQNSRFQLMRMVVCQERPCHEVDQPFVALPVDHGVSCREHIFSVSVWPAFDTSGSNTDSLLQT